MKPYIICHMLSSIDGRIDGSFLGNVIPGGDYEATGAKLRGNAWICGRTTMQLHFALKKPFVPRSGKPAGRRPVFVAKQAKSYAVAVDTTGRLAWRNGDVYGDHLICVVSERAAADYLETLRAKGISYIVAGRRSVDLTRAVGLLRKHFGIRRLLLEGGGNINGGFLQAGLIDELSLLLVPGVDGRREIPTVFDGMIPGRRRSDGMKLVSVTKRKGGTLWLRYKFV